MLAPDQAFSQCTSSFNCASGGTTYTNTKLSDIAPNGMGLQNQQITISGTFTVDRYLGLYNCSVRMMPDAKIVTEGNILLILNCNKFYTCTNDLWSHIQISKGCFFFITDNHFQDAYSAILFEPGYAADRIEVRSGLADVSRWSIWNSQGKRVSEGQPTAPSFITEVSTLPSGVYFLTVHAADGRLRVAKFLITR